MYNVKLFFLKIELKIDVKPTQYQKNIQNVNIPKKEFSWLSMESKCPRCNCLPSECKNSETPYECPKCTWKQCDCWEENNRLE